ncbi:thiol reductase thioredoxin [Mycoplasmopsis pullorum]|uniref:thioredoxin family protein n=1 Tax=Mycoplasmopsis pullorum TaxID=48003 RepID=UPI00111A8F73|nr:thioredoxin family protein [Mycoplasmopsis pullorum]TNK81847.1 thiol reductase thioredoxin [Mycoplasmopsis pullorum]TNK83352.1 thiol reductase thioredoxin [Mycoplasmopsis pullorum]TNK84830.1 thiol reductase thioredoxin [Mycoplasmopsis pullorum]TNK85811.1 thiol reductase thioredoxin [Mycoplasmopsis pullorum]TNK86357.1 thiol reductase thioredoxin [Mycoplasmopsis pullorum]
MEVKSWKEVQSLLENNKDTIYFLEFTTEWCGDCKMMAPIINSLANEYKNEAKIEFIKIDAEQAKLFRETDNKWQILKVPTHIIYFKDKILNKGYEYYPKEILKEWIDKAISGVE